MISAKRLLSLTTMLLCTTALSSPPGGGRYRQLPKANVEAREKLKEAYAAYVQGQYQRAIKIATQVYKEYGDVQAKWFPKWVERVVKGRLPDPYDKRKVLNETIRGRFRFTMAIKSTFPSYLLARSYAAIGGRKGFARWTVNLMKMGYSHEDIVRVNVLPHPSLYGPRPANEEQRQLSISFRVEDYFILVPIDEACKVLGLSCSIKPNPKMGGGMAIRVKNPKKPNTVWRLFLGYPLVERLEGGKGHTEMIAYAPFEERGKVWVAFYWLARQVGIRWWEVRNGKIYIASSKMGRKSKNSPKR